MRLAVLSDIHGNLIALEAALKDLARVGTVDKLWILGDFVAMGPRPGDCIQRTRQLVDDFGKDNVTLLRGNTDRDLVTGTRHKQPVVEEADKFADFVSEITEHHRLLLWNLSQLSFDDYTFLSKLQREAGLDVPDYGHVIGYHAIPGDDEVKLLPDTPEEEARDMLLDREGRLGIGGHIHVQMDRDLGDWRLINSGSVGMSHQNAGYAQWTLLTFDRGNVTVDLRNVPYDTDAFKAEVRASGQPDPEWTLQKFQLA